MKILEYNDLVTTSVAKQYKKVLEALARDDFYTAEVKKLAGTPFYRAKLDYTNRLLFQIVLFEGETYALILEVIYQHDYAGSRFLNGAVIKEENVKAHAEEASIAPVMQYLNPGRKRFNILDKIVSFDEIQASIFEQTLPLILIGSAGSGKTTLTLEKIKQCTGDILYVTHSPYLIEHSRAVYYGNQYQNEHQNIDFLSFKELLETIHIPEGQPLDYAHFKMWFSRHQHAVKLNNAHQVFEEFRGVLTGSDVAKSYLSRADYLNLGIRQSIFTHQERGRVYDCFERYLAYLKESKRYDPNIIAHQYLSLITPKYDFVILDEVQDFTNIQIHLLLNLCKNRGHFIFCGDSNQIVHPNFFSWAKVKTMLFEDESQSSRHETLQILHTNYRNSTAVTATANRILKVKQQRFGSIDKESNYLITTASHNQGEIYCVLHKEKTLQEINQLSKLSTKFAILVMKDEDKLTARKMFQSPLVFSIHEAKGLEYRNIILVDFISNEANTYSEICEGISSADLDKDHHYARAKSKNDKSLEAYKFYINSFYVAITRAVENLYVIETKSHHPFLGLLGLRDFKAELSPQKAEESSLEDWQKEAHKLELQGKAEQAEAIRSEILKQRMPSWTVLTPTAVESLFKDVQYGKADKAQKLLLLEYALIYSDERIIDFLQGNQFHPAQNIKRARDFIHDKYYLDYTFKNTMKVMHPINAYGVNFRNVFNETPLMVAAKVGNEALARSLIDLGADPLLANNRGLTALQLILHEGLLGRPLPHEKTTALYQALSTQSVSLEVDGQLIKIDPHKMEFFLVHFLTVVFAKMCRVALTQKQIFAITAPHLTDMVSPIPYRIVVEYRKKRAYLSSMLSKNEMHRMGPYNHRLFLRIQSGCYVINPQLKVRQGDAWINFYELIGFSFETLYPNLKLQTPTPLQAPIPEKQAVAQKKIVAPPKIKPTLQQIELDFTED